MSLYIGLMSGTSVDGIDGVLADFPDNQPPRIIATKELPYTTSEKQQINALCQPGSNELYKSAMVGNLYATKATALIKDLLLATNKHPFDIVAIGSHGQTVRHHPEHGFTIQIGNHALLAALTGIDVISDFRSMDVALGGQGAPLVPAFHKEICQASNANRFIVNIGGIANVTALIPNNPIIGFDTGPGNTLLDLLSRQKLNKPCDINGEFASTGRISQGILNLYLNHPYFSKKPPKSTGRELFNSTFIDTCQAFHTIKLEDRFATLTELTAKSIINGIDLLGVKGEIYVCGGGVHNEFLMNRIRENAFNSGHLKVSSIEALGVEPDFLEAFAFAWLAYKHINHQPLDLRQVTGANRSEILGCHYPNPYRTN